MSIQPSSGRTGASQEPSTTHDKPLRRQNEPLAQSDLLCKPLSSKRKYSVGDSASPTLRNEDTSTSTAKVAELSSKKPRTSVRLESDNPGTVAIPDTKQDSRRSPTLPTDDSFSSRPNEVPDIPNQLSALRSDLSSSTSPAADTVLSATSPITSQHRPIGATDQNKYHNPYDLPVSDLPTPKFLTPNFHTPDLLPTTATPPSNHPHRWRTHGIFATANPKRALCNNPGNNSAFLVCYRDPYDYWCEHCPLRVL
ncbi:hypothetical protein B0A55_04067 [Friedmanniomyces simplex]|uniref:Uncharacterized protein n=1 Tax=Friedmanniomyces simplex TaxID=329884 RepID=A0A4U0XM17_9PEZI|nr:hypothetical protein B0A55_04067 [Friedmanniomyces simplex]